MGSYLWPFGRNMSFIVFLNGWPWKRGSRSIKVKCKDWFKLGSWGFLFAPIQYRHLSLTVWPQRVIYCCTLCPKTHDLENWGSRSSKVKCKDWFELAAYGFLFAPHANYGVICYCFWDIQQFHLHGKPYSDPQFWGFWGQKAPKCWGGKFWPQKAHLCVNPRVLSYFAFI